MGLKSKLGKASLMVRKNGLFGGGRIISGYLATYAKAFRVKSGDILFISSGVGDSAHYRSYNVAEELRLHGFSCSVTIADNSKLPQYADKFKIFIFQRTVFNSHVKKLIEKIKEQKKEIIFDTDDLVYDPQYLRYMDYFEKLSPAEKKEYKNGIGSEIINDPYVKVCTTTVKYLAEKLREKGKQVFIVPNKISDHELEIANKIIEKPKDNDGYIRIGYYSGTLSHNKDFASISDAMIEILKKYEKVKLVLAGLLDSEDKLNEFKDRIEILPRVTRDKYYANFYRSDISLAPLEMNNPFCDAKSEIKFMEASIVNVPTVAVRNLTFSEAITDGEDGFLAENTAEWIEKISKLIEDENLRKSMGEKAREKILKDYTNKNSRNEEYYKYLKAKL